MTTKATDLERLLAEVFDKHRGDLRKECLKRHQPEVYERLKRDFVFHMTDWTDDLKRLSALEQAPDVWKTGQAMDFLIGFLYHVIPHLNAAGRLLLDEVSDPFTDDETAKLLEDLNRAGTPGR